MVNIVDDTTPQLGGQLDVNGHAIGNGTEELLKFDETQNAVNEFTVMNNSTGQYPELRATGDDTNIGLKIKTKGSAGLFLESVAGYLEYDDDGPSTGPSWFLWRKSSSPADNDVIGSVKYRGCNDSIDPVDYCQIYAVMKDVTDGSEDGRLDFQTMVGGAATRRFSMWQGLTSKNATGGDRGLDTINASKVYDDGTLLTCFVMEAELKGSIDVGRWDDSIPLREDGTRPQHEAARQFQSRMDDLDPDTYADKWKRNGHLSGLPSPAEWESREKKLSTGELIQRLWETAEIQAVHLDKLNRRIKELERQS